MWQDLINGSFETLSGFVLLLHCVKMHQEKKIRGVSVLACLYFMLWSYWNLYYYPHLNQWSSFVGGVWTGIVHTVWFSMILHYIKKEKHEKSTVA